MTKEHMSRKHTPETRLAPLILEGDSSGDVQALCLESERGRYRGDKGS